MRISLPVLVRLLSIESTSRLINLLIEEVDNYNYGEVTFPVSKLFNNIPFKVRYGRYKAGTGVITLVLYGHRSDRIKRKWTDRYSAILGVSTVNLVWVDEKGKELP